MILWAGGLYGLNSICRTMLSQAAGAVLGTVDTGAKTVELKAPAAGTLVGTGPEDGKPVEYGQPLFFIAPR